MYLQVLVDERELGADASVDTSVATASTAVTERHDTDKGLGASGDEGTSRVALAAVLSTGGLGGADHVVGDAAGTVLGLAGGAGDDRDVDVAEGGGAGSAFGGGAPTGHGDGRARSGVRAGGREAHVADGGARWDGGGELEDGNVVVVARVRGVADDLGDLGSDTTGSPVL